MAVPNPSARRRRIPRVYPEARAGGYEARMSPLEVHAKSPAGRLLRAAWQPVARSVDLPKAGILSLRVLSQDWTLWRSEDGIPVLTEAFCPHRGTRLSLGRVQGERLECHHHGICFDRFGRSNGPFSIRTPPLQERGGLIFAWLGEEEAAAFPPIPELLGPVRVLAPERWPCSFYSRLQNSLDIAHVAHAHRRSGLASLLSEGWESTVEEENSGFVLHLSAGGKELPTIRFVMPNRLEFFTPVSPELGWRKHIVWRVPQDAEHCISFTVASLPAPEAAPAPLARPFAPSRVAELGEALLEGQLRWEELQTEHLTEVEDYVALCGGPATLWPSEEEPGLAALWALWKSASTEAG